jgi:hypothetical protein
MRKFLCLLTVAAFCLSLFAISVVAQTDQATDKMQGPPKVLFLIREDVKPGKGIAHDQHEAAWTQAFVKAKYKTPILAMDSVTGPAEMWFGIGYPSFAALEKDNEQMEKDPAYRNISATFQPKESDFVSESHTITARYRPEYSYQPQFNLGEYHYFSVNIIRTRLGSDTAEFYKALNSAREKAGLDVHSIVFQVNSGMPAGTLIAFTPVKSLSSWDEPQNQAYDAALKEIGWSDLVAKHIMNVDMRLFAFNPRASSMPEDIAAADPAFWHPKPVMAKSEAAGKVKPAAKKSEQAKQ